MCVGIPAQVVEVEPSGPHTALVDVAGVRREINTMLIDDEPLGIDEWVLVHVGFAMARVDAQEAAETLAFMRELGSVYDEELEALRQAEQ